MLMKNSPWKLYKSLLLPLMGFSGCYKKWLRFLLNDVVWKSNSQWRELDIVVPARKVVLARKNTPIGAKNKL